MFSMTKVKRHFNKFDHDIGKKFFLIYQVHSPPEAYDYINQMNCVRETTIAYKPTTNLKKAPPQPGLNLISTHDLKHAACIQNDNNFKFKASIVLRHTENTSEKIL